MTQKCIQHIMKEYLLLLKDLFKTLKIEFCKYMISILKYVYIDELDDIVNEYNNKYHRTIKMKVLDVKDNTYINIDKEVNGKILNFKLVIMEEYQNTKTFLLKDILQTALKRVLQSKKLKILFHGHMLLMILMVNKLLELFMKKNCKKQIKKKIRKGNKLYVTWKGYDNSFNSCIDKKDNVKLIYKKWVLS